MKQSRNLIWKLLRKHISPLQLAGFFLANLFGMSIVLLGLQFYRDVKPVISGHEGLFKHEFIVVTKQVGTLSSLSATANAFSQSEIDDISRQPFAERVGYLTPSTYNVRASMSLNEEGAANGMQLSTEMFFESVPNEFIDVKHSQWRFTPGQDEVPIILPKDYINLYNFGFAQSRNLPKISDGVMSVVRLNIRVSGQGREAAFSGRIVGFSTRLNTILVPQAFNEWANKEFGAQDRHNIVRLIVETPNPADETIANYIRKHNYDTEGDKLEAGKLTYFLKLTVGIVLGIGIIISALSFYLLMLSIYLLLQKNTTKLETLLLIGYSPARVAAPYQLLTFVLNMAVLGISVLLLSLLRGEYLQVLLMIFPQMEVGSLYVPIITGTCIAVVLSVMNAAAIRSKINSLTVRK